MSSKVEELSLGSEDMSDQHAMESATWSDDDEIQVELPKDKPLDEKPILDLDSSSSSDHSVQDI